MNAAASSSSSPSGIMDIIISDISATNLRTKRFERTLSYFITITSTVFTFRTSLVRGPAPTWPDILSLSVSNDSVIEFLLFKGERSGDGTRLGSVSVSVQDLLSRHANTNEVGPLLLAIPTAQTAPPPSIFFKLVQHRARDRSDATVRTPILIDQMRDNVNAVASSSRAQPPNSDSLTNDDCTKVANFLFRARRALDKFFLVAKAISEIHPYAKASVAVVTVAYDAWKDQGARDVKIVSLARTIAELWEFMTQDDCLEKIKSVKATVTSMLEQTSRCAEFIRRYTSTTKQVVRFVKNVVSDTNAVTSEFEQSFAKLRADFLAGIDVATVIAVLDTQNTVLEVHRIVASTREVGLETKDAVLEVQQTLSKIEVDISRATISTQPTAPKPTLTRPAPQIFHGRDEFVGDIVHTLLRSDQARVPILGPGGMGKTSVALAVANDPAIVQRFGDRRHFVPCEEVTNPAPLVDLIAMHLGIVLPTSNPFPHLLESLRGQSSLCLIILDNFETPWDSLATRTEIEEIVTQLSSTPFLSLIVTMRGQTSPYGVAWSFPLSQLTPLPPEAARATFLQIWSSDDGKLDDLLSSLDLVPLAVTLIAHVGRSSQLSPSELLESWNKEQTKLLNLGSPDRLRSIDHSIRLSLQSTTMLSTPDALPLLSVVAFLPGGAAIKNLPILAPSITSLDRAVRALISVSLVYKDTSGTLRLLSPVRSFLRQYHPPAIGALESIRSFYFSLAAQCECNPGDKNFLRIRDDVAPEESNMESVLSYCLTELRDEHAVLAVENYSRYLYWHHPRSELLEAAVKVSRQRGFTEILPLGLYRLGNMLISQSEYTRASTELEEAQMLFRLDGNRSQAASCLHRLGEVLRVQSRPNEARTKLEEARAEFDAIGDHLGAAQYLQSLGEILCTQERYGDSRTALEDAQERFQELGVLLGSAQCLQSIGHIQYNEGRYNDAHNILENAQKKFQAIGETLGTTQCLRGLGKVLLAQGQYDEARISFEKARDQYQGIGERFGAAQCLESLGQILLQEACYNDALSALEEVLSQYRVIGYRSGIAGSLMSIGEAFLGLNRHAEARQALEDACSIYREIGKLRHAQYCDDLLSSIRVSE